MPASSIATQSARPDTTPAGDVTGFICPTSHPLGTYTRPAPGGGRPVGEAPSCTPNQPSDTLTLSNPTCPNLALRRSPRFATAPPSPTECTQGAASSITPSERQVELRIVPNLLSPEAVHNMLTDPSLPKLAHDSRGGASVVLATPPTSFCFTSPSLGARPPVAADKSASCSAERIAPPFTLFNTCPPLSHWLTSRVPALQRADPPPSAHASHEECPLGSTAMRWPLPRWVCVPRQDSGAPLQSTSPDVPELRRKEGVLPPAEEPSAASSASVREQAVGNEEAVIAPPPPERATPQFCPTRCYWVNPNKRRSCMRYGTTRVGGPLTEGSLSHIGGGTSMRIEDFKFNWHHSVRITGDNDNAYDARKILNAIVEKTDAPSRLETQDAQHAARMLLRYVSFDSMCAMFKCPRENMSEVDFNQRNFRVIHYLSRFRSGMLYGVLNSLKKFHSWYKLQNPLLHEDAVATGQLYMNCVSVETYLQSVRSSTCKFFSDRFPRPSPEDRILVWEYGQHAVKVQITNLNFARVVLRVPISFERGWVYGSFHEPSLQGALSLRMVVLCERVAATHPLAFIRCFAGSVVATALFRLPWHEASRARLLTIEHGTALAIFAPEQQGSSSVETRCTSLSGVTGTNEWAIATLDQYSPQSALSFYLTRASNAPLEYNEYGGFLNLSKATAWDEDKAETVPRIIAALRYVLSNLGGFPLDDLWELGKRSPKHFLANIAIVRLESAVVIDAITSRPCTYRAHVLAPDGHPGDTNGPNAGDGTADARGDGAPACAIERQIAACRSVLSIHPEVSLPFLGGYKPFAARSQPLRPSGQDRMVKRWQALSAAAQALPAFTAKRRKA